MPRSSQRQPDIERRSDRRLTCRTPVRVYATPDRVSDSFVLESTNISPFGAFLNTDFLFPVGEMLELEFVVPGRARPVRGRGKVVRVRRSADPPGPGLAVHLSELNDDDSSVLSRMDGSSVRVQQKSRASSAG